MVSGCVQIRLGVVPVGVLTKELPRGCGIYYLSTKSPSSQGDVPGMMSSANQPAIATHILGFVLGLWSLL